MHVVMPGTSGSRTKQPWDVRLLDRWARQAKESANDPKWQAPPPPLKERVRSAPFWLSLATGMLFVVTLEPSAPVWARAVSGGLYVLVVVGAARAGWRRRRRGAR
jgi:hypothetical protein